MQWNFAVCVIILTHMIVTRGMYFLFYFWKSGTQYSIRTCAELSMLCPAIRFATTSKIDLMQDRCDLYEQMGEASKALMGYSQMLNYIEPGPENDDQYLKLAHKICEVNHSFIDSEYASTDLNFESLDSSTFSTTGDLLV